MKTPERLLLIVPTFTGRSPGIDSRFIAAHGLWKGLASACDRVDVLTPHGMVEPEELLTDSVRAADHLATGSNPFGKLPRFARVAMNDIRAWLRSRQMRRDATRTPPGPYDAIIQFHHRFQDVGIRLASEIGSPLALRIEAMEVREEATWGTHRPLFGRLVESFGEKRIIESADLLVPISRAVNDDLDSAGILHPGRVVIPNGVDIGRFNPGPPDRKLLRAHALEGRFILGWVGGFRPFHGLEMVPEVARRMRARIPNGVLCLVGNGPLLPEIRERCSGLEDTVRFVDAVPPSRVPSWIRTFDACVMFSDQERFHYSPLKLLEYLACGRPTITPAVGDVPELFGDSNGCVLVRPGDPQEIVEAATRFLGPGEERDVSERGARLTATRFSWEMQATRLIGALETHTTN